MISNYLQFLIFAAGTNAFAMHILYKYDTPRLYDYHRPVWFPEWCDPCCAFWLGMIAAVATFLVWPALFSWLIFLLVPALAAFTLYILR